MNCLSTQSSSASSYADKQGRMIGFGGLAVPGDAGTGSGGRAGRCTRGARGTVLLSRSWSSARSRGGMPAPEAPFSFALRVSRTGSNASSPRSAVNVRSSCRAPRPFNGRPKAMRASATLSFSFRISTLRRVDEEPSRYHGHLHVGCLRARPQGMVSSRWRPALMKR